VAGESIAVEFINILNIKLSEEKPA
jgi:hypothetical protein